MTKESKQAFHARFTREMTETAKGMQKVGVTTALKADIDAGLADITAGRIKDFDPARTVERGKKRLNQPTDPK